MSSLGAPRLGLQMPTEGQVGAEEVLVGEAGMVASVTSRKGGVLACNAEDREPPRYISHD